MREHVIWISQLLAPASNTLTESRLSARFTQLSGGPPQARFLVLACGVQPPSKIKSDPGLELQSQKRYWASVAIALRPRSLASSASNPRSRKRACGRTSVWFIGKRKPIAKKTPAALAQFSQTCWTVTKSHGQISKPDKQIPFSLHPIPVASKALSHNMKPSTLICTQIVQFEEQDENL